MKAAEGQVLERLTDRLRAFGLTATEARLYLHLSKMGEGTAVELAKVLGIQRTEVYAILRSLQSKGIVLCTIRRPAKFVAVPLDRALNLLIDSEKVRLRSMEANKEEMVNLWQKLEVSAPAELGSGFQMLTGSEQILAKISDLISSPLTPKMLCCSGTMLSRMYYAGIFDALQAAKARKVELFILTEVTQKNRDTVSSLRGARVRHVQVSQPPAFVVDGEGEVLFVLSHHDGERVSSAVWSSHKPLIRSMRALFRRLWEDAIELEEAKLMAPRGPYAVKLAGLRRRLTPLRSALGGLLKEAGYKVTEEAKLRGASGIIHTFDIFAECEGRLPLVVDLSDGELAEVEVLKMYAKLNDVMPTRAKALLVSRGKAPEKARELASAYGIKLIEVHSA